MVWLNRHRRGRTAAGLRHVPSVGMNRLCVASILVVLCNTSCGRQECHADWARLALTDFTYVGADANDATQPIPRHGSQPQPVPPRFRRGVLYVFHAKDRVDTEEVALRLLPRKFQAAQVEILDAPQSAGEFAIPNSGGPRWNIRFRYGGCEGEVYNVLDPALYDSRSEWPAGSRDDYVVVLHP